jgi:hypothetical protein
LSYYVSPVLCWIFLLGGGVWTQGLHLELLHLPFFVMGFLR